MISETAVVAEGPLAIAAAGDASTHAIPRAQGGPAQIPIIPFPLGTKIASNTTEHTGGNK
jgi:hypothetical protein